MDPKMFILCFIQFQALFQVILFSFMLSFLHSSIFQLSFTKLPYLIIENYQFKKKEKNLICNSNWLPPCNKFITPIDYLYAIAS